MNKEPAQTNRGNGRFLIILLLILLLAFAMRLHNLTADAPLGISATQELSLDGPATISAGRDMALFGQWNAFASPHAIQIMYPFANWLAFLFFRLLGTSYWSANLISVVTGLLSIALIAGFARQHFSRRSAQFAAFFLAINYIYIIYNRDPMAYTTVSCGMAFILYAWGRGLRQPVWFFVSGAGTAFAALFIKLPAIAFLPAAFIAFLWLILQQRSWRHARAYIPLFLFIVGNVAVAGMWMLFLYQPQPETVSTAYYARTLSPRLGLEEVVRNGLYSVLYMGVDFGFVWRMLPVFVLAYGYTFGRLAQFLTRQRPSLSAVEVLMLLFLLSSLAMLYVSLIRPLRYQIVLIPQMCLVAGVALDRLWRRPSLTLPTEFGRLFPLVLYGGVTYFLYEVITAVYSFAQLQPTQLGFAERWGTLEVTTTYTILTISLFVSLPLVLGYLFLVTRGGRYVMPISWRRALVATILLASLSLQFLQYATMQQTLQYSLVETARQVAYTLPSESTILAGPYAVPLALESQLPAIWMLGNDKEAFLTTSFTHLVVDVDGPYPAQYFYYTEAQLRDTVPSLFTNARLVQTYTVRGYTIHVYKMN